MTEKQISSISKKYAQSIFEIASSNGLIDLYLSELKDILEVFNNSNDLVVVLNNSSISSETKKSILDEIFKGKIQQQILNMLKILIDKNRLGEFESLCAAYIEICNQYTNKKDIKVISSVELDDNMKNRIKNKLEEKLHCEVTPQWLQDKSIIAGLVFKFDDYVIDTSVAGKLKNLSKNILR